jgi:hypothetical protein
MEKIIKLKNLTFKAEDFVSAYIENDEEYKINVILISKPSFVGKLEIYHLTIPINFNTLEETQAELKNLNEQLEGVSEDKVLKTKKISRTLSKIFRYNIQ